MTEMCSSYMTIIHVLLILMRRGFHTGATPASALGIAPGSLATGEHKP